MEVVKQKTEQKKDNLARRVLTTISSHGLTKIIGIIALTIGAMFGLMFLGQIVALDDIEQYTKDLPTAVHIMISLGTILMFLGLAWLVFVSFGMFTMIAKHVTKDKKDTGSQFLYFIISLVPAAGLSYWIVAIDASSKWPVVGLFSAAMAVMVFMLFTPWGKHLRERYPKLR